MHGQQLWHLLGLQARAAAQLWPEKVWCWTVAGVPAVAAGPACCGLGQLLPGAVLAAAALHSVLGCLLDCCVLRVQDVAAILAPAAVLRSARAVAVLT